MNIEILPIHEDYVTTINNFYLNVTEWLASPVAPNFQNR